MNEKQKRFAECFAACANATVAAKAAGYSEKTARSQGQRLLTNVDVQKYIKELQEELADVRISTISQVKAFWSDIMNNSTERTADRLKASELLAKASGVFMTNNDSDEIATGKIDRDDVIIYLPEIEREVNEQ